MASSFTTHATGERLGKIDKLLATVKIEDLYALNLQRNINLEDLKMEGIELWVTFDDQGRTNFRNIHIPPPEPNRRILFAYASATIEIKNGVVHYGDVRHDISGEGRNLQVNIQPDDPSVPIGTRMTSVQLSLSNSTFTYDGRPINNIDIEAQARFNQEKLNIHQLVLKSPVAEAKMNGVMDDWRALRYTMNVTSTVDLTQLSDTLQPGATLRGAGNFSGTITGEGDQFKLNGQMQSDALAADNIRLQGLNVSASGSVQGKTYEINGKAVADLAQRRRFPARLAADRRQRDGHWNQFPLDRRAPRGCGKELWNDFDRPDSSRCARRDERRRAERAFQSIQCGRSCGWRRESKRDHGFRPAIPKSKQRHDRRRLRTSKREQFPRRAPRSKA